MLVRRFLVVAAISVGGNAWGQGPATQPATAATSGQPATGPNGKGKQQEVRKRIQMVRIWELSRVLGLDTKAAASIFPTLNQFDERRAAAQRNLRDAMAALKKALTPPKAPKATPKSESRPESKPEFKIDEGALIQAAMDRLAAAKVEVHRVEMEELAEVRRILTPAQQAKYVLFQQRFQQRIQGIIRKVREAHVGKNPPLEN